MLSEKTDRSGLDTRGLRSGISGEIPEKLDSIYKNNSCIHDIAVEEYGDEFPDTESPLVAAATVGDRAKFEVEDLRKILTSCVSERSERHLCKMYIGARAFNNGE
jgi:hypothetical protein